MSKSIVSTSTTLTALVAENLRRIATEDAQRQIVATCNAAKAATIAEALASGDLRALAVKIRPQGEFALVSCQSSHDFGDKDLAFHFRRLNALRGNHEADALRFTEEAGRKADRMRGLFGDDLRKAQAEKGRLAGHSGRCRKAADNVAAVMAVIEEELILRHADRAAYAAKVAADKAAREAAKVAVMEAAASVPLPAKWLRPQPRVKKVAVRRDEIAVGSFEELAAVLS